METATPVIPQTSAATETIYIVLSQTGTALSRFLKLLTRAPYNHSSVALDPSLATMYSFGRVNPYNPFIGGYVEESPRAGTFGRFHKTRALVLAVQVDAEAYHRVAELLPAMMENRREYHYNYIGLFVAAFGIHRKKKNCYYCSEFVKFVVEELHIPGADEIPPIVKPVHFRSLPHRPVYEGRLWDYAPPVDPVPKSQMVE